MHVCSLFYTFILKNKYDFYLLEYLFDFKDFMLLGLAKNRQYLSEIRYLGDYCGISISNIKWKPTIRISLGTWDSSRLKILTEEASVKIYQMGNLVEIKVRGSGSPTPLPIWLYDDDIYLVIHVSRTETFFKTCTPII